jgi:hypothetical protein
VNDTAVGNGASAEDGHHVSDANREDGATREFNDERAFELVLDNGLSLKLQVSAGAWVNLQGMLIWG